MTKLMKTAALAGVLVAFLASTALELRAADSKNGVREGQAVVTELGPNASATTYWVAGSERLACGHHGRHRSGRGDDAGQHAVARFSAVLFPGQMQVISVPFALGEQQQVLRVRRLDDRIEIARVPGSSNF
jgi:hypothetical protein